MFLRNKSIWFSKWSIHITPLYICCWCQLMIISRACVIKNLLFPFSVLFEVMKCQSVLSVHRNLAIQFHLECTYISLVYYEYKPAKEHIQRAQELSGLKINMTGGWIQENCVWDIIGSHTQHGRGYETWWWMIWQTDVFWVCSNFCQLKGSKTWDSFTK